MSLRIDSVHEVLWREHTEEEERLEMGNAEHFLRLEIGIPTPRRQPASESAFALFGKEVIQYAVSPKRIMLTESDYSRTRRGLRNPAKGKLHSLGGGRDQAKMLRGPIAPRGFVGYGRAETAGGGR